MDEIAYGNSADLIRLILKEQFDQGPHYLIRVYTVCHSTKQYGFVKQAHVNKLWVLSDQGLHHLLFHQEFCETSTQKQNVVKNKYRIVFEM